MENKDDRREWPYNLMEEMKLDHRSLNFKIRMIETQEREHQTDSY